MENIIFLDIDGVLNSNNSSFSLESIETLKQLVNIYNAKIVMTTSRQQNGTESRRKFIKNQLEELGIYVLDFIDPNFEGSLYDISLPARLLGIVDYLLSNYVILDDGYHNDYRLICLNHYWTKPFKGLTFKELFKITFKSVNLNNFKSINYKYRKLGQYELLTNKLIKTLKKKYENDILIKNK